MKINDLQLNRQQSLNNDSRFQQKKEEMAMEFERMFARKLVQEMTKGLFEQDDNQGMMSSGSGMYRRHIVDTLSQALAKERKLGMADMVSKHWNRPTAEITSSNSETKTDS